MGIRKGKLHLKLETDWIEGINADPHVLENANFNKYRG